MRIIHITGNVTPAEIEGIMPKSIVVDSKTLLTDAERLNILQCKNNPSQMWNQCLTSRINEICSNASTENVIFVGKLNVGSPTGSMLEFPTNFAKKYYIESRTSDSSRSWYLNRNYEALPLANLKTHLNSPNFLIGDMESYTSGLYERLKKEFFDTALVIVDEQGVIRDELLDNMLEALGITPEGETHHKLSMLWQKLKYPEKDPMPLTEPDIEELTDVYELVGKLGHGAFGQVFHGRNRLHEEPDVAIKLFQKRKVQAWIKEVRIHEWLTDEFGNERQHKNILMYYGSFKTKYYGIEYYALKIEYFTGKTIREIITAGTVLSREQVADISIGVLSAIKFLHSHRIVHRDVKLDNVMYNEDMNRVFLIDLGLADFVEDVVAVDYRTTRVVGTPIYIAPETFKLDNIDNEELIQNIVYKNDIWALGVMLFELITRKGVPWSAASTHEDLEDMLTPPILTRKLERMREFLQGEELEYAGFTDIVMKMLEPVDTRPDATKCRQMVKALRFPKSCVNCEKLATRICTNCDMLYCSKKCSGTTHPKECTK